MRLKPKKSLGQNFLVDPNIRRKIVESLHVKASDQLLEIGAGRGELTLEVAKKVKSVIAVEIDDQLCAGLKHAFAGQRNIRLIHGDILKLDLGRVLKGAKQVKVLGNIPYYISSPIVEYLFHYKSQVRDIFLTVQKEFAQRMMAEPGGREYSSFTCFIQYHAKCQKLFAIKRGSFFPAPKVDSVFLHLSLRPQPLVSVRDEELFFRLIRTAFNQRRKTLRKSLKNVLPQPSLESFFRAQGMDRNARPETLTLQNFSDLLKII